MNKFIKFFTSLPRDLSSGDPMRFGKSVSIFFSLFILVLALLPIESEDGTSMRVVDFLQSPFNEIGDTIAGIAGVLAFLWIIVTVQIQSRELSAQKEELELTRQELSETKIATQGMAKAQEEQVALLAKQGEIFKQEQHERFQASQSRFMDEIMRGLLQILRNSRAFDFSYTDGLPQTRNNFHFALKSVRKEGYDSALLYRFEEWLSKTRIQIEDISKNHKNMRLNLASSGSTSEAITLLHNLDDIRESLSHADQQKIVNYRIPHILEICRDIYQDVI